MQENEKTYERDIYMEERNEELEMSADTELKKETEIQTSENSEKASADSEPEKKERPAANFGLLDVYKRQMRHRGFVFSICCHYISRLSCPITPYKERR